MPVTVMVRNGKSRVVEAATGRIAKNNSGTALDGGGHTDKEKAKRQASAINANLEKKKV